MQFVRPLLRSALLAAAVAAVVASSAVPSDASRSSVAADPLAVWETAGGETLGHVDPATLLPAGKQVGLIQTDTPVLSPGRRWVAFSGSTFHGISLASVAPLRQPIHSILIRLPRESGDVLALAWPKPQRLVALAGHDPRNAAACCRTLRLYVVDPLKRRILRTVRLPRGFVISVKPTRSGLAILLGGYGKLASGRLLLVTGGGAIRTVALARFRVGFVRLGRNGAMVTEAALAVGPSSAYVLGRAGGGNVVAVAPLARGHAAYHAISAGPTLVRPDGGFVLLPGGRLGVACVMGLYVYDTHSWQQVGSMPFEGQSGYISGDTLLLIGSSSGVDVYNLDGTLRYHVDTPSAVGGAVFVGDRAFLPYEGGSEWGVLDLDSGTLYPPVVGSIPDLVPGQADVPAWAWSL